MARRRYVSNEERIAAIAETLRHDREKALHEIRNAWQLGLSKDIDPDVSSELESIVTRHLQMPRRGLQFARYLQASPFWDLNSIDLWYLFGDFASASAKFLYGLRDLERVCRNRDEALVALREAQLERRHKKIKCPGVASGVEWSLSDLKRAAEAKKQEVQYGMRAAQAGGSREEQGSKQLPEQSEEQESCRRDGLPLSRNADEPATAQNVQPISGAEQTIPEEDRSNHGQVEGVEIDKVDHRKSLAGVASVPQRSKDQTTPPGEDSMATDDESCDISFGADSSMFCFRTCRRPISASEQEERTVEGGWQIVTRQDADMGGEHRHKEAASEPEDEENTSQHPGDLANSQHEAGQNISEHQDVGAIGEHGDESNTSDRRFERDSSEHRDEPTRRHDDQDTTATAELDETTASEHDDGITLDFHDRADGVFSFDQDRGTTTRYDQPASVRAALMRTRRISGISEKDESSLDSTQSVEVARGQAAAFQAASDFSDWLSESSRDALRPLTPHLKFALQLAETTSTRTSCCCSWKAANVALTSVNTDNPCPKDGNCRNLSKRSAPASPSSSSSLSATTTSPSCSTPGQVFMFVSPPTPPTAHHMQQEALHKPPPSRPRLPLSPPIQFPVPLHLRPPQLLQLSVSAMSASQAPCKRRASPGSSTSHPNKRARMPTLPTLPTLPTSSPPAAEWQAAVRAWLTSFMPDSKTLTTSFATADEHSLAIANLEHSEERRRANYGGLVQFRHEETDHAAFIYIHWQDRVTNQCATLQDPPSVQSLPLAFTHHFHLLPASADASENLASVIAISTAAFGCNATPPVGMLSKYQPPVAGLWVLLIAQWHRIMLRTAVHPSDWNAEEDDSPLFTARRDMLSATDTGLPDRDPDGNLVTSLADTLRRPRQIVQRWNKTADCYGHWRDEAHNAVSLARRHIVSEGVTLDRIKQQIVRWKEDDDDDSDDETLRTSKVDKYRARAAESESRREKMQCWTGYVLEAAQQHHELVQHFMNKAGDLRTMCHEVLEEEMEAFAGML